MAEDPTPQPQPPVKPATAEPVPTTVPVAEPDTGYTSDGVPTFDGVREKIESRYGTALGATELAEDTTEVKTAAQEFEARQRAAEKKLEEIRASMHEPD